MNKLDAEAYQARHGRSPVKGAQFCSEWCAAAAGLPAPTILNPRTLGEWCEYLGGLHDFA